MFRKRLAPSLGLFVLCIAPTAPGQTAAPPAGQSTAPAFRGSTADEGNRAEGLDRAIEAAAKADRWDEAIARAEDLLSQRTKARGPKHWATVNAGWRLKAVRRLASMPREDRVAYMDDRAGPLQAQGKSPRPSRSSRRRWTSIAESSATTTSSPPSPTATWRPTSWPRGNLPPPNRYTRRS